MKAITDLEKLESFKNKLSKIVTSDMYDLHTSYLERVNWVAVPVEDDPFFDENALHIYIEGYIADESFFDDENYDRESYFISFVTNLKKAGYQSIYTLIDRFPPDNCFELDLTKEDIYTFDDEYSIYESTLFPKDLSFVILWADDYSIIAGDKKFVESLIGCDLETAMNVFKKALNPDWSKQMIRIYEKYKSHNEKVLRKLGEG